MDDPAHDRVLRAVSGVGISCVVFGHAKYGPTSKPIPGVASYAAFLRVVEWIYTFHMPLFFVISGYLLWYATLRRGTRDYPSYPMFLRAKAARLLAPYLVISALTFPFKVLTSRYAMRPVTFSAQDFLTTLLVPWQNTIIYFWFLPSLFLMFALAPLLLRPRGKGYDALLIALCVGLWAVCPKRPVSGALAVLNLGGMLNHLLFFVSGFTLSKYGAGRLIRSIHPGFVGAGALSFVVFWLWPELRGVALLHAGLGVVGSLALARLLVVPFSALGRYSFDIYLFSWFPQVGVRVVLGQMLGAPALVLVACSVATGMMLPAMLARVRDVALPASLSGWFGGSGTPKGPPSAAAQARVT